MAQFFAILLCCFALSATQFSTAQTTRVTTTARTASLDARFLSEKRDLAGLLGEVHYIRTLCNGQGDQYWRDHMRNFLDIEAVSRERRRTLVDAFNNGYAQRAGRVGACTADVGRMEARLSQQGRELAETIAAGYLQ